MADEGRSSGDGEHGGVELGAWLEEILSKCKRLQQLSLEAYDVQTLYPQVSSALSEAQSLYDEVDQLSDDAYAEVAASTPGFEDMYDELNGIYEQLDALAVRLEEEAEQEEKGPQEHEEAAEGAAGEQQQQQQTSQQQQQQQQPQHPPLPRIAEEQAYESEPSPDYNAPAHVPLPKQGQEGYADDNDETEEESGDVIVMASQQLQSEDLMVQKGERFFLVQWNTEEQGYALVEDANGREMHIPHEFLAFVEPARQHRLPPAAPAQLKRVQQEHIQPPHSGDSASALSPSAMAAQYAEAFADASAAASDEDEYAEGAEDGDQLLEGEDMAAAEDSEERRKQQELQRLTPLGRLQRNPQHRTSAATAPHVGHGGLYVDDLNLDRMNQGQLQPIPVPISTAVRLTSLKRDLPVPGNRQVIHRHVRMALFDGQEFVANVLQLRAARYKKGKGWRFDKRSSYLEARDDDGVCLVRCSSASPDLSLAFEFSAQVADNDDDGDGGGGGGGLNTEEPCGWCRLPLYREDGRVVQAGSHKLQVFPGPIQINQIRRDMQEATTHFEVKVSNINKKARLLCDRMPRSIVIPMSAMPALSLYREVLAHTHAAHHQKQSKAVPVSNPLLAGFPAVVDNPHLLNLFNMVWTDSLKALKKQQKSDKTFIRSWFQMIFTQKIWPLLSVQHEGSDFAPLSRPSALDAESAKSTCCTLIRGDCARPLVMNVLEQEAAGVCFAPFDASMATFRPPIAPS